MSTEQPDMRLKFLRVALLIVTLAALGGTLSASRAQEATPPPPAALPAPADPPPPDTGLATASDFVTRLYQTVLLREPDPAGLAAHIQNIQQFGTVIPTVLAFFKSQEFLSQSLSDQQFLDRLYHTFLNRAPDQAGLIAFLVLLQSGCRTRDTLIADLTFSPEFKALLPPVPAADPRVPFVAELYGWILNRPADLQGLQFFVNQLQRTTVLSTVLNFLHSAEFTIPRRSATDYVSALYLVFLGRAPDCGGLQSFVAALNPDTDAARDQMPAQFVGSQEFQNKLDQLFPPQDLFVTDFSSNAVTVYSRTATGNTAPIRTLQGAFTGLNAPFGVAVDTVNNELLVTNRSGANSVTIYNRTATGNAAPSRTLSGAATGLNFPTGLALDLVNNELLVASTESNTVTVYSRTASGSSTPLRTLSGASTGLNGPRGLVLDLVNNELLVVNFINNSVTIHSRTASGNAAPLRTLQGAATGINNPVGLVVDPVNNELFVANFGNSTITVYSRTASGSAAPLRTLSGAATALTGPAGLTLDLVNNELLVVNFSSNAVTVYSRTASGNAAPLRTLQGAATGLSGPQFPAVTAPGTLTVTLPGTGTGTVTSTPEGITCPGTCTANFNTTSTVALTATPSAAAPGSAAEDAAAAATFVSWGGACASFGSGPTCLVTIAAATTAVTATFNTVAPPPTPSVTVTVQGTGTGTVTSSPTGINCPGACTVTVTSGATVTLTATPTGGSTFVSWGGDGAACGTNANCTLSNVTTAKTVTATFTAPTGPNIAGTYSSSVNVRPSDGCGENTEVHNENVPFVIRQIGPGFGGNVSVTRNIIVIPPAAPGGNLEEIKNVSPSPIDVTLGLFFAFAICLPETSSPHVCFCTVLRLEGSAPAAVSKFCSDVPASAGGAQPAAADTGLVAFAVIIPTANGEPLSPMAANSTVSQSQQPGSPLQLQFQGSTDFDNSEVGGGAGICRIEFSIAANKQP